MDNVYAIVSKAVGDWRSIATTWATFLMVHGWIANFCAAYLNLAGPLRDERYRQENARILYKDVIDQRQRFLHADGAFAQQSTMEILILLMLAAFVISVSAWVHSPSPLFKMFPAITMFAASWAVRNVILYMEVHAVFQNGTTVVSMVVYAYVLGVVWSTAPNAAINGIMGNIYRVQESIDANARQDEERFAVIESSLAEILAQLAEHKREARAHPPRTTRSTKQ